MRGAVSGMAIETLRTKRSHCTLRVNGLEVEGGGCGLLGRRWWCREGCSGIQLCEKLLILLFYDLLWRSMLQSAPMRLAMCD